MVKSARNVPWAKCVLIYVLVLDLPAYGCVQTPLSVSYLVRNRTLQVQEVEVTVEPSDAFMYSGHKQVRSSCLSSLQNMLRTRKRLIIYIFLRYSSVCCPLVTTGSSLVCTLFVLGL